ncbi:tetratricopeptide repeat protein [Parasphingorhabdus sp.]|uniref:tetratricopeptide repeat protein n=1 Tax=Parasphingorhabdus sp. TaxID=2709688 RepID=UPI003593E9C3
MAKDKDKAPEEKPDHSEQVFMREVDEAVREDQLKSFVARYGLWVFAVVIIGLASLAGWIFYQNSQNEDSGLRSEEYVAAIDSIRQGNLDGAASALEPLMEAKQAGYRAAAQMLQANIALEKDEPQKAIAGYGKIIADDSLPRPFRDLALIRQTTAQFDTLKPQQVIDRLKPLAVPGNPWFGSAGEMVALSYLNMNKSDLAGPLFAQLAKDQGVPATIRSRALQMAGVEGIDAVESASDERNVAPLTAGAAEGEAKE